TESGAVGAAKACAVTHTLVMIAQWALVSVEYQWKPWSYLWKPIITLLGIGFTAVSTFAFMSSSWGIWQEGLATGLGMALGWGWIFTKNGRLA
ncbi:MAG: hypothetical protein ACKOAV_10875, partial [Bacteroidota bacterium]